MGEPMADKGMSGLLYVPFWCQNHPAADDENVLFPVEERDTLTNLCPAFRQEVGRAFLYLLLNCVYVKQSFCQSSIFWGCTFFYPSKVYFSFAQKLNFLSIFSNLPFIDLNLGRY